jgi:predicted ATPase
VGRVVPDRAIDALLTDEDLSGVLLCRRFREAEVDAAHPLAVMLDRWQRLGVAPPQLRLQNLPPSGLALLLGEMLRLEPREAARLAEAVGARTAGNPFDTVELVNALRREGALVPDEAAGWSWDPVTIRRFVGTSDVIGLLTARIDRLPAETRRLLEVMACLSGEAHVGQLAVAAGLGEDDVRERLAPALEDGLLVPLAGDAASGGLAGARFRHDRVLEAAHEHLSAESGPSSTCRWRGGWSTPRSGRTWPPSSTCTRSSTGGPRSPTRPRPAARRRCSWPPAPS